MNAAKRPSSPGVIFLTLILLFFTGGCSVIHERYGESCKSHAYIQPALEAFITKRFPSNAQVRMAVIPFSVPANLASRSSNEPGSGNQLAWGVQSALLKWGTIPIVEVLNRQDWPGKKEEFYTGNFGALQMAREAGYDLVLIGYMKPIRELDTISIDSKIIDVESGITLWYGNTTAFTREGEMDSWSSALHLSDERHDHLYFGPLFEKAAMCIARDVLHEPS